MKGRKIAAGALALLTVCGLQAGALADLALDGSVVSAGAEAVRAPFGGVVEESALRPGDMIHVGDKVASIVTAKVYAPQDGMISSVCAQAGDSAEGIIKRYGAVLYIEPTNRYAVTATTEKAYNSSATKYVHIGEVVYLCCTQDGTHQGTARVTTVEAADESGNTKYTLEVTGGEFYVGETVGIFRKPNYASESRIGRGTVAQNTAVAVEGAGSVLKMHVSTGDYVERGQLLFETVDGVLDGLYAGDSSIISDLGGIVATVDAANGASVTKDGNLITVYPLSSLQIEAQVSVLDLAEVNVGDEVSIEFDLDPEMSHRYPGRVESISYISAGEGNQKYYNAYISFTADDTVRMGMPAIVYLNSTSDAEPTALPAEVVATEAPATEAPATEAPATEAPATEAPATEAPATEAPATEAPATEAPATEAPATEAPATEAPATEAPATEAPATEAPATEAPAAETSATEAPATEASGEVKQCDAILGQSIQTDYNDWVNTSFTEGNTLYLQGSANLYAYRSGDADLTAIPIQRPEASDESQSLNVERMFSDGTQAYALVSVSAMTEESSSFDHMCLYRVNIGENVTFEYLRDLDWSDMTSSYGMSSYPSQINDATASGGNIYLMGYNDNGDAEIHRVSMESGEAELIEIAYANSITPYKNGGALVESFDYSTNTLSFTAYDPETQTTGVAAELTEQQNALYGMAYSTESDRLFYLQGGCLMAVTNFDFENAQQVAELSASYYDGVAGRLLPGDLYCYTTYEVTMVRVTDPERMQGVRLKVQNNNYSDTVTKTYYDFSNSRSDVATILSNDYVNDADIIDAMMNRSGDTDVYVLSTNSQAFSALYQRGYMADLSSSEKISTAVAKMYPALQSALLRDGQIIAVPVEMSGWTMGVNYKAFEKLGITEDQIPKSWPGFLDLLTQLPQSMQEGVTLFYDGTTVEDARRWIFQAILESYQNYLTANGQALGYNTPELRTLLEKLSTIDFEALGLEHQVEDEEGRSYSYSMGENSVLLETGVGCTIGNMYSDASPVLLSITEDSTPILPVQMGVAFVNPFSEHQDVAISFLETLMDNGSNQMKYNISDELNEPIRSSYYEQNKKEIQDQLDQLKAQLEQAEPADKPDLEASVSKCEEAIQYNDDYGWDVGPKDIAFYRANSQYIVVQQYSYMYNDSDGEISELIEQYLADTITMDEMLQKIEQKVQMMELEGN